MRSLSQNWLDAMVVSTPEIRFLAELHVATTTSYKFLSGPCTQIVEPESILDIAPVSRSIDPVTRAVSVQALTIRLARDELTEYIIKTYGVVGGRLELLLGAREMAEVVYENAGVYLVESPRIGNEYISLPCVTSDGKLSFTKVTGYWLGMHPLEIIADIADKAGIPAALIDGTSFDPTQYGASISHFNLSRANVTGMADSLSVSEPTIARVLVDQLAMLLDGSVVADEDGVLQFKRFDSSASTVADLTDDDFSDDLDIEPIYKNMINSVTVSSHPVTVPGIQEEMAGELEFTHEDANSQANYGTIVPSGATIDNVRPYKYESSWINAHASLDTSIASSGTGMTFDIVGFEAHSFCGARWPGFPAGAQPATAAISAARPAYLKIDDEIIRCESATVSSAARRNLALPEPRAGLPKSVVASGIVVVNSVEFTVAARAQFGTAMVGHTASSINSITFVYDVTIQQALADAKINRFSNGGPTIKVRVSLQHFALEIGDLVTLTTDRFITLNDDSLTTATKLEVVGRQLDLYGSTPGIWLTLSWATKAGPPAVSDSYGFNQNATNNIDRQLRDGAMLADATQCHISSGFGLTGTGGFGADLDPGVASSITTRNGSSETISFTYTASKDTYMQWDLTTASVDIIETALAAGAPSLLSHQIPLWKVVTDGAGVTGTTDRRVTESFNGENIIDDTIDTTQIAADAVTTTEILDETIQALNVADGTIGIANLDLQQEIGPSVIFNGHLGMFTRG